MVMMHPEANAGFRVGIPKEDKWVDHVLTIAEDVYKETGPVRRKMAHFYMRRHGMLGRNPLVPWEGSCNIVLPLIDKHVTKQKAGPIALLQSSPGFVTAMGLDPDSYARGEMAERYVNSVLGGKIPKYSQQDFLRQMNLIVENQVQHGLGFARVDYDYSTRSQWQELRQTDLPGILKVLVFMPRASDAERAAIQARMQDGGYDPNPPTVLETFGAPVNPVTGAIFDAHRRIFESLVADGMDLDASDEEDKKTLSEILKWMRAGMQDNLVVKMRTCISHTPRVSSVMPNDLFTPMHTGSIDSAPILVERCRFFEHEVREMGRDRDWSRASVDSALSAADEDESFFKDEWSDELRMAMGDRNESDYEFFPRKNIDRVELLRCCFYNKIAGGGMARVVAWVQPHTKTVLEVAQLPYNHGMWGYVDFPFEENECGLWTPRGVPEIIDDPDAYATAAHRARINSMMISTARGFFVRKNSGLKDLRWSPTMMIEVDNPSGDVLPIAPQPAGQEWMQEEFFHQNWVEDHLGSPDTLTRDARLLEPITATESQDRSRQQQRIAAIRGGVFVSRMNAVVKLVLALGQQWAPDRFLSRVGDGDVQEMRRESIQGSFAVEMAASVGSMDPDYLANKAMRRLQVLAQMRQAFPEINTDPRYVIDPAQAVIEWLDADDQDARRRIIRKRPAEQAQAMLQGQQQEAQRAAQLADMARRAQLNEGITREEQAILADELTARMPHKALQRIIQEGEGAKSQAENAAALLGSEGAPR